MIKRLLLILVGIITFFSPKAQFSSSVIRRVETADTVIILIHKQTHGIIIVKDDDPKDKGRYPDRYILHKKPNWSIITAYKILPDSSRKKLVKILNANNKFSRIDDCCFIPFYAILMIKDGIATGVDIDSTRYEFTDEKGKVHDMQHISEEDAGSLNLFFSSNGIDSM